MGSYMQVCGLKLLYTAAVDRLTWLHTSEQVCHIAAIFDGHGGRLAADYMSKNLYEILSHNIDDETHNTECDIEGE